MKGTMQSKKKRINEIINNLADSLPEKLTGNRESMSQKYSAIYSRSKAQEMVISTSRRNGKLYLLVIAIFITIILTAVIKTILGPEALMDLSRSSYEGDNKILSAEIEAKYNGETQKKDADITIQPKGLTKKEKKTRIRNTKKNLHKIILGNNSSLSNITSRLELVTVDPSTGVEISWKSDNEVLIDNDGIVNPLISYGNEKVVLDAQLRIEDVADSIKVNVTLGKPETGKELSDAMEASVNNTINNLSESDTGKKLVLPDKTQEGVSLKWKQKEETGVVLQLAMVLLIGLCIYYSRYSTLNKKIKETRDSILRDFPDFINKLVLLLNAGLVVTAAFEKISYDYRNRFNKGKRKHLYEEFCAMEDNIKSANSGFLVELNEIAQRSGVRDVMRFNTIIIDNIDKGSALVDKLQSESQILWTGRIKMAEEKGRLAETKLTFPMVLQLLVLIIITIAPAAMEM